MILFFTIIGQLSDKENLKETPPSVFNRKALQKPNREGRDDKAD